MLRVGLRAALPTIIVTTILIQAGQAQVWYGDSSQPGRLPVEAAARPVAPSGAVQQTAQAAPEATTPADLGPYVNEQPGYVQLNAPLYPSPKPNVPHQVGMTMITNQALYPHEMLYPHQYRALYPPYYYVVDRGGLLCQHDHWHLVGTEVKVKYNSHVSPFRLFSPPSRRSIHTPVWHHYTQDHFSR